MDIQAEKLSIIQQLIEVQDEQLLRLIKDMLFKNQRRSNPVGKFDELPQKVKESIAASIQELDAGGGVPHELVMAELKAIYQK
jgi:restriction endonuclease S subunit